MTLQNDDTVTLALAESGTLPGKGPRVCELRRLDESGHPKSIPGTDYQSAMTTAAAAMFARWHQENFFKYMREH